MTAPTNRDSDKFMLRLPVGMRELVRVAAEKNHRSMNSEIVDRLTITFNNDAFAKYHAENGLKDGDIPPEGLTNEEFVSHFSAVVQYALSQAIENTLKTNRTASIDLNEKLKE